MEFTSEIRHLLEWTTEHVLPVIINGNPGIPLQELDISGISLVNDSMVSMDISKGPDELPLPGLTPPQPPRKRGNRNTTPGRASVGNRRNSRILPGASNVTVVRSAAFALIDSMCCTLGDWVKVSKGSGGDEICDAALKWSTIFDTRNAMGDKENPTKESFSREFQQPLILLLGSFAHLCGTLGETSEDFRLLKRLITITITACDQIEDDDIKECFPSNVEKAVKKRLRSKSIATIKETIKAVLDSVYESVLHDNEKDATRESGQNASNASIEMTASVTLYDVVGDASRRTPAAEVVVPALEALANHKKASRFLVEQTLGNFESHIQEESTEEGADAGEGNNLSSEMLFEAKLLLLLSQDGGCRRSDAMKKAVARVKELYEENEAVFEEGSPLTIVIRELIEDEPGN